MAKRTVTDIAREQGVTEAEVKEKLDAAGTTMGTDDEFKAMLALVAEHRIKPVIDRVFPLTQAVEANRLPIEAIE